MNDKEKNGMSVIVQNCQKLIRVNATRIKHDINLLKGFLHVPQYGVGVQCTTNDHMQQLNKLYRNIDAPTDVLSFSTYKNDGLADLLQEELYLGDIVFAMEYIRDQSLEDGLSMDNMMTLLCAHSLCHLIGHDHETDTEWVSMMEKENLILDKYNEVMGTKLQSIITPGH